MALITTDRETRRRPPSTLPDYQSPGEYAGAAPSDYGGLRTSVDQAYQQFLGRTPGEGEYSFWLRPQGTSWGYTSPNWQSEIAKSPEAQARQKTAPPTTPTTGPWDWTAWDALTQRYPGTVPGLEQLIRDNPQLGASIVGGSRGDIRLPSGEVWDVIRSAGTGGTGWQRLQNAGGGGGTLGTGGQPSGFSDPYTQQLEAYLNQWLGQLGGQGAKYQSPDWPARLASANTATDKLTAFLNERAARLQQPAYTGAEQEVFRTQATDPIERDRQAARQRVLQNISARGLDPSSGIAQQLMNEVDAGFDRQRGTAQNELAYRQIAEQRGREQEAQTLLGLVPQAQRAAATGDLSFLQQLDAAQNQPYATGLPLSSLLYQLPQNALQQALAVLGQGGANPSDLFSQAMQLYTANQNQRNQGLQWYEQLGALLPYLANIGR